MASRPPQGEAQPRPRPRPDPYAHERGMPTLPQCGRSPLALRFDGTTLAMAEGVRHYAWSAVSGRAGADGGFDNSARRQAQRGEGPIPAGRYWIDPSELWDRDYWNPFQHVRVPRASWGDYRLTIHVYPGTRTHGRGGFFVHGGSTPGSAGCIDLAVGMNNFVEILRLRLNGVTTCYIELLVAYP